MTPKRPMNNPARVVPRSPGWLLVGLLSLAAACGSGEPRTTVRMDFSRPAGLFDAPFPADDLRSAAGIDLSLFPNPDGAAIVDQVKRLLDRATGFSTTGGVFFAFSGPVDPAGLPDVAATVTPGSPVFLIGIDPDAADYGMRYPLEVELEPVANLYAADNMLSLMPLQGVPLRAGTRYAAVVTTTLSDIGGANIAPASAAALAGYSDAVSELASLGVQADQIAGMTVFTTGDPTAEYVRVREAALARPLPVVDAPFARTDLFDDFCVYQSTIGVPDYQSGTPPFKKQGGTWEFDAAGDPVFQRVSPSTIVVTVPRSPLPSAGYPLVVFVRTGGGGNRPLVDRGARAASGGGAIEPGEGPARYFARAGFAGLQIDGPHGGLRDYGGDEQFLMFNVNNLGALRDNVRQSALELSVIAHVAAALELDASDCPPAGTSVPGPAAARFDSAHFALMGHSMGATIGPLTVAYEPLYGAMLLSGAGGSWLENLVHKRKPVELAPIIGLLLGQGSDVRTDDPMLSLAQWALESADPPVYGEQIVRAPADGTSPRHVLMMQGIVDNYILPRIANTTSLSLGLDLAGPELDDAGDPRLDGQTPLGPLLPLVGRAVIPLPASGNVEIAGRAAATAVVIQYAEDGLEDGHEVVFQTAAPKRHYQCFLATWLAGTPFVPDFDAACP